MKKYYIPFLLVSCMLFFGCNKNSTATETETTQSTPSKKFKENVNKSCTYIAYRDKVIVLDNKNNIAKLTNLNDVESSDKVINYNYEDMCNLIDQLTVEKIHISGPNNVLYGISYAHDSTDKDSQKNENKEDKDFDLSNADMSLDELKIIIEGNKKETTENYDKVLEDCLTAIVNTINFQGVNTISVVSNTQNTEPTK